MTKKGGSVRICGDFKTTINQASPTEHYPLPRAEDLFAYPLGGSYFTKLDMSSAYLQLQLTLSDSSKQVVTINTHKGLFHYNRLPFGVAFAPAIFQRTMETLLRSLNGVSVYIDDILVTGATIEQHMQNLEAFLDRLEMTGLCLNKMKYSFLAPRIEYLGYAIDEKGLHPMDEKIAAIRGALSPTNVTELHSFLGIVNYYSRFLLNLATKLTPLYHLLHKKAKWTWTEEQEDVFKLAKEALQTNSVLVHYDSSNPLLLVCDASEYGNKFQKK